MSYELSFDYFSSQYTVYIQSVLNYVCLIVFVLFLLYSSKSVKGGRVLGERQAFPSHQNCLVITSKSWN